MEIGFLQRSSKLPWQQSSGAGTSCLLTEANWLVECYRGDMVILHNLQCNKADCLTFNGLKKCVSNIVYVLS